MSFGPMQHHFPGYQILDEGPLPLVISRLSDGLLMYANPAFFRLTGYCPEETIGRTAAELGMWNDLPARARLVEGLQRDGYKHNLLIDMRRKTGEVCQVLCNAQVITVEGEACILNLISDLREVDGQLAAEASERAHMEFVEAASKIGFWQFDAVRGTVHWSPGMEALYGLEKGSFKGTSQDFFDRIHPDDLERNQEESRRAIANRQAFDLRFRIIRTDCAVRWVASRGAARCAEDGSFLGAAGIQIDITPEVEGEQQAHLQAEVINALAEGVAVIEAETGLILSTNPRFDSLLGYPPGFLVGRSVSVLNGGTPEEQRATAEAIMAEMRRAGAWRGELKNRHADGREIWISANVVEIQHAGLGKIWITVHSDITERRLAQDARDAALSQLRRLSLNLQQSLEAERLALSRDVHDQLGAALTGIRMKLESLGRGLQSGLAVTADQLLGLADTARETQVAAREICTRLRPALLDDMGLVEACRWYLDDWSAQVGIAAQGRFGRLPLPPSGRLATDMFRVMQELLTNVARHAHAGQVRVLLCASRAGLVLRVRDNGCGFAPDASSQGFGLLGVQERVRQHQGTFHIDSGASGTTVTITLQEADPP